MVAVGPPYFILQTARSQPRAHRCLLTPHRWLAGYPRVVPRARRIGRAQHFEVTHSDVCAAAALESVCAALQERRADGRLEHLDLKRMDLRVRAVQVPRGDDAVEEGDRVDGVVADRGGARHSWRRSSAATRSTARSS